MCVMTAFMASATNAPWSPAAGFVEAAAVLALESLVVPLAVPLTKNVLTHCMRRGRPTGGVDKINAQLG